MFFKRFIQDNTRQPAVKSVNQLINNKSHKQKKYISLMVVPSYSTGKTRTLRVPRALLHGIIICILVVSAVVTGINLRANYFQRMAQNLDNTLSETNNRYYEFRAYAEQVQDDLLETASQIYAELTDSENRAQSALDQQADMHQTELESLLGQIEDIERIIREFDEDRRSATSGLSSRAAVIPPLVPLLESLERSQVELSLLSAIHNPGGNQTSGIGLMSFGSVQSFPSITHENVSEHLQLLVDELAVQRKLLDCLEYCLSYMDIYLHNFPTLWPITGQISSHFGWRTNPFGGRGSEHHQGIDIRAATGTIIRATGGGTVVFNGWRNGYGNTIIIDHGNGIQTLYAHNSVNLATVGQTVQRGEIIARVGTTGRTTGPHVHYEVIINGVPVDPWPFMQEFYS